MLGISLAMPTGVKHGLYSETSDLGFVTVLNSLCLNFLI